VLGVALTLLAVSVGVFWAVTVYDGRKPTPRSSAFAGFPVFFNGNPVGVRDLATAAMHQIAAGGRQTHGAKLTLARLGGAALPYVLPLLDSLGPRSRERVALALTPIAVRMGVATPDELSDGEQAVLFWGRFWQDRAVDFRTASVQHLTSRLAERSSALRAEDLIHVDTFALPALIQALGDVKTSSDVARVQRLNAVLAHVTDLPERGTPDGSVKQAARTVEMWRDFWEVHGGEYSVLDGPRRLAAVFVSTQYGKWLAAVLRGGFGRCQNGETAQSLVESGLGTTSFLLFVGLAGGFSLGVSWTRFERRSKNFARRYGSAIAGTALAAIPCATFVRLVAFSGAGLLSAASLVALTTGAWVSRHLARSTISQGVSPRAAAFSVSAPLGAIYPPFVLSAIVLVELAFHLPGLGRAAALSLSTGDVNGWMAATLALALVSLVLRQAADLLRPRAASAPTSSSR
jgi:ABC-type dipeptide/oligopeptide/nickel transport system permease component